MQVGGQRAPGWCTAGTAACAVERAGATAAAWHTLLPGTAVPAPRRQPAPVLRAEKGLTALAQAARLSSVAIHQVAPDAAGGKCNADGGGGQITLVLFATLPPHETLLLPARVDALLQAPRQLG